VARITVITGGTSGLGRATALAMAYRGHDVILTGRSAGPGERVAGACRQRNPAGRAEFLRADLSSQADVRALAAAILDRCSRIDLLINNAGARYDRYGAGADGIERTFAANHLGHFLLTMLLLPRLELARPGRVITLGSSAHHHADPSRGWFLPAESYDRKIAYANSKLANVVFARELADRTDPALVTSNAVDPGIPVSRFASNNGWLSWAKHYVSHGLRRELVSASAAATGIVRLGTTEFGEVSGRYFKGSSEVSPSRLARDPALGRQLWELSLRLTGSPVPNSQEMERS
jgi:NAD(P)-dependent dehydrogenase (short-subunit alcohol dehydrogenase family)